MEKPSMWTGGLPGTSSCSDTAKRRSTLVEPGEEDLHRLPESGCKAGWSDYVQRAATAAELAVEDQERQPSEMIAVQMGDGDGSDVVRLQAESFEADERARPAVDEQRLRYCLASHMQASLQSPPGAEGVTGSCHGHPNHVSHVRQCLPRRRPNASR